MISYNELIKKPRVFKSLTGVTPVEFDDLLAEVTPIWLQQEQDRLNRPERQRNIGGGRRLQVGLTRADVDDLNLVTPLFEHRSLGLLLWGG